MKTPSVLIRYVSFLIYVLILLNFSCKEKSTDPSPPSGIDTTSHIFSSWAVDTLGDGNNSALFDVVITNDSVAYAVGEMYLRDSTGQYDPQIFNLAKWNGVRWELGRIPFVGVCSAVTYPRLRAIWTFGQSRMLVTNGGSLVTYDGTNAIMDCRMNSLLTGALNKIYAVSPQDVYVVGNNGCIVHFNGNSWERMESGTTLPLLDIHGRSASEIYACGSDFTTGRGVVLRYDGTRWTKMVDSFYSNNGFDSTQLFRTQLYGLITSVWTDDRGSLYAAGDYVYRYQNGQWSFVQGIPDNFLYATLFTRSGIHSISGNTYNDYIAVGERTTVMHYNGSTGIQVGPMFRFTNNLQLYSVDMKHSQTIAVGSIVDRAGVLRLRR